MNNITVTSFTRTERLIAVDWKAEDDVITSHFYKHCDGSWHADPETRARGQEFLCRLNEACIRYSEKKPVKKIRPKRRKRERIQVWFG